MDKQTTEATEFLRKMRGPITLRGVWIFTPSGMWRIDRSVGAWIEEQTGGGGGVRIGGMTLMLTLYPHDYTRIEFDTDHGTGFIMHGEAE